MPETQTVDGVLETLKRRAAGLQSIIGRIKMKLQAKTHADLQQIRSRIEDTHIGMSIISGQLDGLARRQDLEHLNHNNNRNMVQFATVWGKQLIDAMRQEVRSEVQAIVTDHSAVDFAAEAKTMVLRMAQENAMLRNHVATQQLQIEYNQSRQPSPRPIPTLSDLDLMRILDVDPRSWTDDLSFVLRQASRMSADSQARARWLMKTPLFQRWLGSASSALVLAVGALRLEKVSPMSVLTSTIALSLIEMPNTVVLHFFCGAHLDADAEDSLVGPRGMLRSLIAQFLIAYRAPLPVLSAMGSQDFIHDCYNRTLPALCEVFRLLVEGGPQDTTIFVLIDGISWYEQPRWVGDLEFIVGLLKDLSVPGRAPILKVLLTSPSRTAEVHNLVNLDTEYISLAPGNMDYTPIISRSLMELLHNKS